MVFGPHVLEYSRNLCQGHYDYLVRLPDSLLLNIMVLLDLEDVAQFAQTCCRFKEVSQSVSGLLLRVSSLISPSIS